MRAISRFRSGGRSSEIPAPEVARALEREKRRRGISLNQTVIDLLGQGLGVREERRSNGLARLAGTWTEADLEEFEAAVADTERIDDAGATVVTYDGHSRRSSGPARWC